MTHMESPLWERHYFQRLRSSAPAFLEAITKYLTAKVLELVCNEAQEYGSRRITPKIVDILVHNSPLLSSVSGATTMT